MRDSRGFAATVSHLLECPEGIVGGEHNASPVVSTTQRVRDPLHVANAQLRGISRQGDVVTRRLRGRRNQLLSCCSSGIATKDGFQYSSS